MAFPWMAIAMLGSQILPMLFGKQTPEERTTTQETISETPPSGYQSPLLGLADPLAFEMLLRNMGLFSGAGMPGGVGPASPQIANILQLLGSEWPKLLEGYSSGGGLRPSGQAVTTPGGRVRPR